MANVASGISSTIAAGLVVGGLANVAGNVNVGQNVTVAGTMTVGGKPVLTQAQSFNWSATGGAGQKNFTITGNTGNKPPVFVSRNGLIEVPGAHYTLTGNVLTFSTPCIGGETIYGYWSGQ